MKKILTCAALSVILLSGCSFVKEKTGIIKVNDNYITQAEFNKAIDKEINASFLKNFGGADNFVKSDENALYAVFKDKAVNELIIKSLLDTEIEKRGIKVEEDDIREEMKSIIDKVVSKEELNRILKQRGVSNKEFSEDLKTQIRIKKLVESIEKINITDAEAEKFYRSNIDQFKHTEQVRASHILISADLLQLIREYKSKNKNISAADLNKKVDEKMEEQRVKAEKVLAEVKANPDNFEQLAEKYSDDKVSAERGGELGFFARETMVKEFSDAAFSMKPTTLSDKIVQSNYGYHIIKVTDRIEAGTTPFVKVKEEIKYYLATKEQMKVLKNLTDGLMKTAKIEYVKEEYKPSKDIQKQVLAETKQ